MIHLLRLRILPFYFVFCCCQFAFSQENFVEGKVIFQSGDTLSGYIDYRNWSKSPTKVLFKESLDHESSTFLPGDIQGFHVQKERYVSAHIRIETSPIGQARLTIDSSFHYEETTAFLQALVLGSKSLFYLKDIHSKEQFYLLHDGEYELLRHKKYLRHIMAKIPNQEFWLRETQTIETQDHILQLLAYLGNCADISYELNIKDFDKKSLKSLFKYYYTCIGHQPAYQSMDEKILIKTGVVAGFSATQFQMISSAPNFLTNIEFPLSIKPSLGLSVEFVLPRNRRRWSFYTELLYLTYQVEGIYELIKNNENHSLITASFGQSCIKLNTMPRFTQPIGPFAIFVQAGLSNGLRIRELNDKKTETWFLSSYKTENEKLVSVTQAIETELSLGLGLRYKNLSLQGRYEMGNVPSFNLSVKGDIARAYVLVGYQF